MSLSPTILHHGLDGAFTVMARSSITVDSDGYDSTSRSYLHLEAGEIKGRTFDPDTGLRIVEAQEVHDADHYETTVSARGLLGGDRRVPGYPQKNDSAEGWDGYVDAVITHIANRFSLLSRGTGGFFVCTESRSSAMRAGVGPFRAEGVFRGLRSGSKYIGRQISCPGYNVTLESGTVNISGGGSTWNTPRRSSFSLPRVQVIDTYYTTQRPQTIGIPGSATPPSPPGVRGFSLYGPASLFTWHWPNGWVYTVESSQPFGGNVGLYVANYIYTFQPTVTP